ncbi:MAG: methylmalonyl Co-A mutase-associated GTPase MeaB [Betaproteobacteria bacterium]|jgi:LAO/AO transport system kinase
MTPDHSIAQVISNHQLSEPYEQRRAIAKMITLLESTRLEHREKALSILDELLPFSGNSFRIGVSGVPGVGKSTFIEVLGLRLIQEGHKVAVLAVDPSSSLTGGSILGDKTRMERLSVHEKAFIRPSPASGNLGGVAAKTRESMLVVESAGYDIVIVETVGVGQSEIAVANMTDIFVLMQLPNAGDDLQAIKKGVMEVADLIVINKADLHQPSATQAEAFITGALRLFGLFGKDPHNGESLKNWVPKVMSLSALKETGIDDFIDSINAFKKIQDANGSFLKRRQDQAKTWMWERIEAELKDQFRHHPDVKSRLPEILQEVNNGKKSPSNAAHELISIFKK